MPRILLVPDVKGWAWWWMAKGLQRYQPDGIEFVVMDQQEFAEVTHNRRVPGDAVLQFSWTEATHSSDDRPIYLPERNCTVLASHGAEFPYPVSDGASVTARIATALRNRARAMSWMRRFDQVLCVSQRLKGIAGAFTDKAVLTWPGVDHQFFQATPIPERDRIVIGWCGQSTGVTKGYREVLVPLMDALPNIEFRVNDRSAQDAMNQEEMREWYRGIDVFLSTSCSEGFQMPPLEAMACGRPVIATDCGGIPYLVEQSVTGWVLPGWDTECDANGAVFNLATAIRRLTRPEIQRRGEASRRRVESFFTWKQRSPEWARAILG